MGRRRVRSGRSGFSFSPCLPDPHLSDLVRSELTNHRAVRNDVQSAFSDTLHFCSLASLSSVTSRTNNAISALKEFIRETADITNEANHSLALQSKRRHIMNLVSKDNDIVMPGVDELSDCMALSIADTSEALGPMGSAGLPKVTREFLNSFGLDAVKMKQLKFHQYGNMDRLDGKVPYWDPLEYPIVFSTINGHQGKYGNGKIVVLGHEIINTYSFLEIFTYIIYSIF